MVVMTLVIVVFTKATEAGVYSERLADMSVISRANIMNVAQTGCHIVIRISADSVHKSRLGLNSQHIWRSTVVWLSAVLRVSRTDRNGNVPRDERSIVIFRVI